MGLGSRCMCMGFVCVCIILNGMETSDITQAVSVDRGGNEAERTDPWGDEELRAYRNRRDSQREGQRATLSGSQAM